MIFCLSCCLSGKASMSRSRARIVGSHQKKRREWQSTAQRVSGRLCRSETLQSETACSQRKREEKALDLIIQSCRSLLTKFPRKMMVKHLLSRGPRKIHSKSEHAQNWLSFRLCMYCNQSKIVGQRKTVNSVQGTARKPS